jgi:putative endopeptidase
MMPKSLRVLLAIALLVFLDGQAVARKKPAPGPAPVTACTDFYEIGNHDWLQAHPLPATANSFSRWDELNALADRQTRELLTHDGTEAAGPAARLLADFIASGRDPAQLVAGVRTTAKPLLAKIDGIRAPKDIAAVIAALQAAGIPAVVDFDVLRDPNTGQPRGTFLPASLGLPGPEFYGRSEPALKALANQYRQAQVALLTSAGVPSASAGQQADAALTVETALAKAMSGTSDKVVATKDLAKTYPMLQLGGVLKALASAPDDVTLRQPDYFKAVDKLLAKPTLTSWRAYLRIRVMAALADALPDDPRRTYLATLGRAPATSMPDRLSAWARNEGADLLDLAYGDAFLGSDRQQQAQAIGEAVRAAMARAVNRATWLSPEGKAAAIGKLGAMRLAIGTPVVAISLEGLAFDRDNLAGNYLAFRRWNHARSLARLQAPIWPWPVDQTRPVIGYQEQDNRLIVTASALQAPVFGGDSLAANYGALGALIGQQISLAFADLTGSDGAALQARMSGLVAQYSAYPAAAGVAVDGQRSLRMNAADLSGLELAWDAYRDHASDASGDQAFFRAWASLWARQDRESIITAAAPTPSAFAPSRWRVNGPLANLPAFAQAFACPAGQPMVRTGPAQIAIWR